MRGARHANSYDGVSNITTGRLLLRRSAAEALLIQKPEFQTILVFVRCLSGKNKQITEASTCACVVDMLFAVFEQSIFKVPKKTADLRLRNDLPGP